MVDKKVKEQSRRSELDQHNDATNSKLTGLEIRLAEFIERFDVMTVEMLEIKKQQEDLIKLIRKQMKK